MLIRITKTYEKWFKRKVTAPKVQKSMDTKIRLLNKADNETDLKDIDKDIHFPVKGTSRVGELMVDEGPGYHIHFFIDDSTITVVQGGDKDVNLENDGYMEEEDRDLQLTPSELEDLYTFSPYEEFWRECLKEDPELRRVVLEGILEDLQSDDEMTIGAAQSSLENYLHVYMREKGNRNKMLNIVEQIYAHEGFGKEKMRAWLEKQMEDILQGTKDES